jgi:adenosylmethionine-8-amino-7-oxononanoate aminotransferase
MASRDRIVALDKQRVWHPYTPMDDYCATVDPIVVDRADGAYLYDVDGRRYIDANSSWWVAALGHNHPRLVAALRQQADRNCHSALAGMTHEGAAELAEALCSVAPEGLESVFYSDNGSTAVEVALKAALQYWNQNGRPDRKRFVSLEDAFHGETLGVTCRRRPTRWLACSTGTPRRWRRCCSSRWSKGRLACRSTIPPTCGRLGSCVTNTKSS